MTDTLDESRDANPMAELPENQLIEDWSIQQLLGVIFDRTELKLKEIAEIIKVDKEKVYKWAKGTRPASEKERRDVTKALIAIVNAHNTKLEEDKIKYLTKVPTLRFDLDHPLVSILLYEDGDLQSFTGTPLSSGTVIKVNGKDALIACRNTIPFIISSDGFINIHDDGLGNKFKGGLWIAITKQKFFKNLYAGYYHYIIGKNHKGILKRIRISANNSVTLISDVKEEDNITISLDDIVAVFTVDWFLTKQFPINEKQV